MTNSDPIWGASGPVSIPAPRSTLNDIAIDMEGFVFTPYGLRVNISEVDREELIASGYRPVRPSDRRPYE